MKNKLTHLAALFLILTFPLGIYAQIKNSHSRPNVIIILTDDQGYGDLGCNGNPWIQTPNIDLLYSQSVRFTEFHVAPTCAPTRAGLMTGKYCNKVGVWHTILGREMLSLDEKTLAQSLKAAGYHTGIFGKWHLGDNYPYRPGDRGFDESVVNGGGGVGQQPDYWGNDYFNDTYFHNGTPEKYNGYCTDIWFSEAFKFIKQKRNDPFFCYISTNAPHSPFNVAKKYLDLYKDNPEIPNPAFYGMITNIDENIGKLRKELKVAGLADNTILIFMTDNGTAAGAKFEKNGELIAGFNAGMRGGKSSPYEGGHRVPFFLHWPAGGINKGINITKITSYIDLAPTILDLCGAGALPHQTFDGISLEPLIFGDTVSWPQRILFTDNQRKEELQKWKQFAAMTDRWRLVGRDELYDILRDPGERNNIADANPATVAWLTKAYEAWWKDISVNARKYNSDKIGTKVDPIRLNSHDIHCLDGNPAWSQALVRSAQGANGFHAVEAMRTGMYEFKLYRWPKESNLKLNEGAPEGEDLWNGPAYKKGVALNIKEASIKIGNQEMKKQVNGTDSFVDFVLPIKKGNYKLECRFMDDQNVERDAYYVYVHYLGKN